MSDIFINKYITIYISERFAGWDITPIAGDASGRRFFRVAKPDSGSMVIMEYGSPFQELTDDIILTRIFQDAGLPVASIVHSSPEGGFLVLEDLGERTLENHRGSRDENDRKLYAAAVELAAQVANEGTAALEKSARSRQPALDRNRFRYEMEFFLEHFYRGFQGYSEDDTQIQPLRKYLLDLADRAAAVEPMVLCHRDYHSRNLIISPDGRMSMVDIQDARRGPLGYDLASLLWDAYADLNTDLRDEMIRLFKEKSYTGSSFEKSLHLLALQRMVKALGTFGYQISVLGRKRYRPAVRQSIKNILDLDEKIGGTSPIMEVFGQ